MPGLTPSQTVGPYFHIGFKRLFSDHLTATESNVHAITIVGQLLDGNGVPIPDGVFEFWQPDQFGQFARVNRSASGTESFPGWARIPTDSEGRFKLRTIKPGAIVEPEGIVHAPHISVVLFMRGLLRHLYTRIYFEDEPQNQSDQVLQAVTEHRRRTLVAPVSDQGNRVYSWNVVMQGAGEIVFFDW